MLRKGQVAMEFTIIAGFLFVTLIIFTLGIIKKQTDLQDQKEYVVIRDIGYRIKQEVDLAYSVQPEFRRNFSLPGSVEGVDYSIAAAGNVVRVYTATHEFSLMVPEVNGCIGKGNNTVTKFENGTIWFDCT